MDWTKFWSSLGSEFSDWTNYMPGSGISKLTGTDWNWNDLFAPGSTALTKFFDLNGSSAAQTQFDNQLALNHDTQAFNAAEAEKQRAWEQEMSSTAYQRQVADMQAAGINPYALMANGYNVGNTPSGSSAQASSGSADMANNKLTAAAGIVALFLRYILAKH